MLNLLKFLKQAPAPKEIEKQVNNGRNLNKMTPSPMPTPQIGDPNFWEKLGQTAATVAVTIGTEAAMIFAQAFATAFATKIANQNK